MAEATNFKFGVQIQYKEYYQKYKNKGQKGYVVEVTWPTVKFWDPLYISGTAKATNFKSGMLIDY